MQTWLGIATPAGSVLLQLSTAHPTKLAALPTPRCETDRHGPQPWLPEGCFTDPEVVHITGHQDDGAARRKPRRAVRLRLAALLLVGVVAAVPLVSIGASFALATDSALPYFMMAILPGAPALALWFTGKPVLKALAAGLVVGAMSLATPLFLPGFWGEGAGLLALAVVIYVAPKTVTGEEPA
jgi:hypothetical protein